jgi:pimeloyl-ACP methyl ester carboxylesterase
MSTTTVLITEPADSVLRKLATRLLGEPELRVVCFGGAILDGDEHLLQEFTLKNGELQLTECEHLSIDEVWHAKNSLHSFEESLETTQWVLSFVRKEQIPIIHYLSTLYTAGMSGGLAVEETITDSWKPVPGSQEECHRWNERAIERSGCRFGIYRIPLVSDSTPQAGNLWAQFVHRILRFKEEIEDRIPGYFTANPLRINLSEEGTVSLVRLNDVAEILQEISAASDEPCPYFHVTPYQPRPLRDYCPALAELTGVRLQMVFDAEQINSVDKLFGLKVEASLAYLNCKTIFATEQTRRHSTFAKSREAGFADPKAAIQDALSAADCNESCLGVDGFDWRHHFEAKQVLLPEEVVLNYYVGGKGNKTIVLLNTYGQSFRYWNRFIQALSAQVRVILWVPREDDYETIGITRANPQAVHADDLDRVLTHEGIETCMLVGWCTGPKLALEYCLRYPRRVSSMVFIAASFKGLPQHKALETSFEKNLEPLLETIEKYPETAGVVLEYLKGILLAQDKRARSIQELASLSGGELQEALSAVSVSLQEMVLEPFCAANIVAYAKQMRDFWKYNFLPAIDRIEVPVLFIGGDCDRIASQAIARVVAAMIPQARYLEIQGGTHYVHYEQWDLLAQVVEDVVNSGGKLKLTQPWVSLTEPSEELTSMRQSHA